jgi:hypothetical protein
MIPGERWWAVIRTEDSDPFYKLVTLMGWLLVDGGRVVGGIPGVVVYNAEEQPGFICYMDSTQPDDHLLTLLRAEGRQRHGWAD